MMEPSFSIYDHFLSPSLVNSDLNTLKQIMLRFLSSSTHLSLIVDNQIRARIAVKNQNQPLPNVSELSPPSNSILYSSLTTSDLKLGHYGVKFFFSGRSYRLSLYQLNNVTENSLKHFFGTATQNLKFLLSFTHDLSSSENRLSYSCRIMTISEDKHKKNKHIETLEKLKEVAKGSRITVNLISHRTLRKQFMNELLYIPRSNRNENSISLNSLVISIRKKMSDILFSNSNSLNSYSIGLSDSVKPHTSPSESVFRWATPVVKETHSLSKDTLLANKNTTYQLNTDNGGDPKGVLSYSSQPNVDNDSSQQHPLPSNINNLITEKNFEKAKKESLENRVDVPLGNQISKSDSLPTLLFSILRSKGWQIRVSTYDVWHFEGQTGLSNVLGFVKEHITSSDIAKIEPSLEEIPSYFTLIIFAHTWSKQVELQCVNLNISLHNVTHLHTFLN